MMSKKMILFICVLFVLGIGSLAVVRAQSGYASPQYVYDVVVVDMPPPATLTDNRSSKERLAGELANLLNTNAIDGWEPSQMWGTGPVFVVLKRPKK